MTIESLVEMFRSNGNAEDARAMDAYMKDHFPHLGIRTPQRRELQKSFLKLHPPQKEWIPILWALPEREFQLMAVDLLVGMKKKLTAADLPMVETVITNKSWWDTVDLIASHVAGSIFRKDEDARRTFLKRWIESQNMWLNRTAILHQLTYKYDNDEALLYECILPHIGSGEFFHQKAIGWALREYAKVNPDAVKTFVATHQLKPLSVREALKHFRES
ncbi:DNA alkylation repair protein [Paenibacillus sp. LHD-117]|uniref:DNA alkylation repair protein n=1 Tax=Paenibacillus sp. LHD-117 TaxID=3071412 RepID=UPI0027E18987|nr:DNA alkylation repair protein [Paenibacillus sp. LHD-117]MDQ6421738.1 DNA alkylation repair protein [Paenibacillus sp. LHD-117]